MLTDLRPPRTNDQRNPVEDCRAMTFRIVILLLFLRLRLHIFWQQPSMLFEVDHALRISALELLLRQDYAI